MLRGPGTDRTLPDGIAPDGTVAGCVLHSEYPVTIESSTLIVDETTALVTYDCNEPRMSPHEAQTIRALVFEDPELVLHDSHLELRDDRGNTLALRPPATPGQLEGEWTITTIDGRETVDEMALRFPPEGADATAELLGCGQVVAVYRYDVYELHGSTERRDDVGCIGAPPAEHSEFARLTDFMDGSAAIRLMSPDRLELYDGGVLVELRPSAA